jgi:hypothetical protein
MSNWNKAPHGGSNMRAKVEFSLFSETKIFSFSLDFHDDSCYYLVDTKERKNG